MGFIGGYMILVAPGQSDNQSALVLTTQNNTSSPAPTCSASNIKVYPILPNDHYSSNVTSTTYNINVANFLVVNNTDCNLKLNQLALMNLSVNNNTNFTTGSFGYYPPGLTNPTTSQSLSGLSSVNGKYIINLGANYIINAHAKASFSLSANSMQKSFTSLIPEEVLLSAEQFSFTDTSSGASYIVSGAPRLVREFFVN